MEEKIGFLDKKVSMNDNKKKQKFPNCTSFRQPTADFGKFSNLFVNYQTQEAHFEIFSYQSTHLEKRIRKSLPEKIQPNIFKKQKVSCLRPFRQFQCN